ncbi:hypothetical protein CALVIDRAFT_567658 [Calocera viscosa TUFC12733]|uniref:FUN34 transmembrane protein n=1 Tax=Calocera viscosa (strain TUFC12733) TaxID=1330018 RepID=A0A167HXD7_CALVF|nr:hypothetical protein CALVIDRAFT_567658 [Calocera viscosa TUFC12733]
MAAPVNLEKGTANNNVMSQGTEPSSILADEKGGPTLGRTLTTDTQPAFPVYHRRFANPSPLGLYSFASTTLMLSLINVGARGLTVPNAVVGMAFGYGGLCQLLAGMWEFASGNTFGATAFTSYGGFWFSYAIISTPAFGIGSAYTGEAASQLPIAIGIFLEMWFIVTVLIFFATFRSSIALSFLFFTLAFAFLLLGISNLLAEPACQTAGGAFGIVAALTAYYAGSAGLYSPDTSYFILPVGELPKLKD